MNCYQDCLENDWHVTGKLCSLELFDAITAVFCLREQADRCSTFFSRQRSLSAMSVNCKQSSF